MREGLFQRFYNIDKTEIVTFQKIITIVECLHLILLKVGEKIKRIVFINFINKKESLKLMELTFFG